MTIRLLCDSYVSVPRMLLEPCIRRHCCRDLLAEQQQRSVRVDCSRDRVVVCCGHLADHSETFPVIHDVATLTSSEDEEERVPDTDCKTRRGGTDRQNGWKQRNPFQRSILLLKKNQNQPKSIITM